MIESSEYTSEYDKIQMEERTCNLFLECTLQLVNKIREAVTKHENNKVVLNL